MDESRLPESMRRRLGEHQAEPAIDQVRSFLRSYFGDAYGMDEVRAELASTATVTTRGLERDLAALERVLQTPLLPGEIARLVSVDGNWVLSDPSDAGARAFIEQVVRMLREIIAATPPSYLNTGPSERQ
jgi:hypothetical protein